MCETQADGELKNAAAWEQIRPELDQALSELPPAQREAIVLRYLCGLSQAEAATACACPPETLHTRVQRGLEYLRRKLSDRGVRLSLALLLGALSHQSAQAAQTVPGHLATSLFTACVANTGASQSAVAIAASVQRDMLMLKTKMIAAVLFFGILTIGVTSWLAQAADTPPPAVSKPAPVAPKDSPKPATPPANAVARWQTPQKIDVGNTNKAFPIQFLQDKKRTYALFVADAKSRDQSLMIASRASVTEKWGDATASDVARGSLGCALGDNRIYLTENDGNPGSNHSGALFFVETDTTGKKLKRYQVMPAPLERRYLGSRVISNGKRLVILSSYDKKDNTVMDLFALTSKDGGETWSAPHYVRRDIHLGDLADPSPCAFGSGNTVGWFFAEIAEARNPTGINLAISDDNGATWREQKMPPIKHASRNLTQAIPLATAATGDRVYLAAGAMDGKGNMTYFLLSSADRCKTWGEAVPISHAMKFDDLSTTVSLTAKDSKVAFAYTETLGKNWTEGPMQAHVTLSEDGGASWINQNPFSGVLGSALLPQVLIDPHTGNLHAMVLLNPEVGKPFIATRTYSTENAPAEPLPKWLDPSKGKNATPESF